MAEPLRWGILGTGNIARQFAAGMATAQRGRITAVASRKHETAIAFATKHSIPSALEGYAALIDDPSVEAVYNSLPNSMHYEWTIRALRAGKHVLCEKPLASNVVEALEMFDAARGANRVLVEAFMYRSHPLTRAVFAAVDGGAIGQVRLVRSSFCYRTTRIDGNIRFSKELAGGALMDIGCYCVNFSRLMAGCEPDQVMATGRIHETGVDEIVTASLHFPNDIVASFTCGMGVQADNTASVCGTDGFIEIPLPWKPPSKGAIYTIAHGTPPRMDTGGKSIPPTAAPWQTHSIDSPAELYAMEADDFAATVQDGAPPAISQEDSLGNMRVLDELRQQVGLSY